MIQVDCRGDRRQMGLLALNVSAASEHLERCRRATLPAVTVPAANNNTEEPAEVQFKPGLSQCRPNDAFRGPMPSSDSLQ